jgi:hypothetical protein
LVRVSWIRRFAALSAALSLASALLGAPPLPAQAESRSEAPAQEIAAPGPGRLGVVPNAPKRGADSTLVWRRSFEAPEAATAQPPRVSAEPVGGSPPALQRWCLAHSTSTSSP